MTNYETLLKHLFSLTHVPKRKENLDSTIKLASLIGNPQEKIRTVHVAGTNGKGSVCFKIAEALRLGGYSVGLYSSPHLFSYTERIVVNQKEISKEEVVQGLQMLLALAPDAQFFELTTLLAFHHFAQKNVDIAVIETGLGGRLDATNIIHPLLTIITTIDFDHEHLLGSTLEAIAKEKGGIIKEKTPLILGRDAKEDVLKKMAGEKNAPVFIAQGKDNEAIAELALDILAKDFPISAAAKSEGLKRHPRFRFQRLDQQVIVDVAHNPSGFRRLFQKLEKEFPHHSHAFLFALSKEKPIKPLLPFFKRYVDEIALFSPKHEKLKPPSEIAAALSEGGYQSYKIFETADAAFKYLIDGVKLDRMITVTGSFYMMEEVFSQDSFSRFSTS